MLGECTVLALRTTNLPFVGLAFSLLNNEHMAVFVADWNALRIFRFSAFAGKRAFGLRRSE